MAGKELPYTPGNNKEIIARVEKAKGPVGPGHHNAHRTEHLMEWLRKKESKGGKFNKADAYRKAVQKKAGA